MRVEPLSKALGAELVDFDITRPCTTEEAAELRRLFTDYHLLLVRGQDVTAEDQTIVYQPPHLGPKTLLVNELQTSHIVELPRDEGEALLQEVFSLLYGTADLYTHDWEPDDVIIWDNLALQHCRPAEMGSFRRHLRRQSLDGWYTDDGVIDWVDTVVRYEAIQPEVAAGAAK